MFVRSLFVILLATLLFSCQDRPIPGENTEKNDVKPGQVGQVQLKAILDDLSASRPSWKQKVDGWKADVFYTWGGNTFTAVDGLSKGNADYFKDKLPEKNPAHAYFLVLHSLLSQKRYQALSTVIFAMPEKKDLAVDMCLAWGWDFLKRGNYSDAGKLFQVIEDGDKRQRQEAAAGRSLATVMAKPTAKIAQKDLTAFSSDWTYSLERKQVDFFRSDSSLNRYAESANEVLFTKARPGLLIADMIFVLGGMSKERVATWRTGIVFVEVLGKNTSKLSPVYRLLNKRFRHAIAWGKVIDGERAQAKKIFDAMAAKTEKAQTQTEGLLGLAFVEFSEDPDLENIGEFSSDWPDYRLAGRKFSFYRSPKRQGRKESLENACEQHPKLRDYLVLYDVFCLLGQKNKGKHLLRLIMERYTDAKVSKLCLEEEKEMPRDVYAESQIWEKLD